MAYKVKKNCRICGNEYVPCADCENDNVAFHWRKVACSRKCAMEYFKRVEEARNKTVAPETVEVKEVAEETVKAVETAEVVIPEKKIYRKKTSTSVEE